MSRVNKYNVVLFDLDGTLIDTSEGIFNSVRFAEKKLSLNAISDEKLNRFIGPPPVASYMENHRLSKEMALEATKYHRQYGSEYGIYEAKIYSGIPELLEILKNTGIKLGVCTLKRQDIAKKVLKHFNLYDYFDVVVGIDSRESLTKADTVNIALQTIKHNSKNDVVLIGDSEYDAEGAEITGISFIGVLYGFGLSEKSKKYEVVSKVEEILNLL